MDMNADGRPDLVHAPGGGAWNVYLNNGQGFEATPLAEFSASGPIEFANVNVHSTHFDFNGDGLPDRIQEATWFNGTVLDPNTWAGINSDGEIVKLYPDDPPYQPPTGCDSDGHGNPAICQYVIPQDGGAAPVLNVFLNTGRGFEAQPIRNAIPYVAMDPYGATTSYIGCGFEPNTVYVRYQTFSNQPCVQPRQETYGDFFDVNGDGLPDFVYIPWPNESQGYGWGISPSYHNGSDEWQVVLNRGGGKLENLQLSPWQSNAGPARVGTVIAPRVWSGFRESIRRRDSGTSPQWTTVDVFDWNGDGILDLVDTRQTPWKITLNGQSEGSPPEIGPGLLVRAHNGARGTTDVRYTPSTQFEHLDELTGAPALPLVLWVTTGIRRTDGLCTPTVTGDALFDRLLNGCIASGNELVETIEYAGGRFDASAREFRGFRMVMVESGDGNVTDTTFDQADFTRGKMSAREVYAGPSLPGNLVQQETYVWKTQQSLGRTQVYLEERGVKSFSLPSDPSLDQWVLRRNEPPDDYGRVSKQCTLPGGGAPPPGSCNNAPDGQVDTITTWANPASGFYVFDKPSTVKVRYRTGQAFQTLTEQWFYYDNRQLGFAEKGNVTKVVSILVSAQ